MKTLPWIALLAAAVLAGPARGDLTIETRHDGDVQRLYLADHMFSGDTQEGRMVFRGDKKVLWAINPQEKTYTELTEADVQALGAKMDEATAQMQEALKNVPPEQRAMMEKMMSGRMPALKPSQRTVKATGETRTINGFETKGYIVTRDDGETTEVWAAAPRTVKIDPKDLQVFKEFGEFMKAMVPGTDPFKEWVKDYQNPGPDDVPGFPILTVRKDEKGKELWRSEVVTIERGTIPAERFEVPAGYQKEESPLKG